MYTRPKADENNERNVYRPDPSPPAHMLKKLKFFARFLERTTSNRGGPPWDPDEKKIKTKTGGKKRRNEHRGASDAIAGRCFRNSLIEILLTRIFVGDERAYATSRLPETWELFGKTSYLPKNRMTRTFIFVYSQFFTVATRCRWKRYIFCLTHYGRMTK